MGLRYMAGAAFSFSIMSLLVKVAGARVPTMEIVFSRSLVMALLAGVGLMGKGALPGREPRLLVLRGLVGFVALSCFFYAVVHLPLADATVIQYTSPVFTSLFAAAILAESLRRREVTLAFVSLIGVVLVARPSFLFGRSATPLDPVAVAAALSSAVFSSMAYVVVRRLREERALVIVLYFAVISAVGALPTAPFGWIVPTRVELLVLIGVGVATHVGQIALVRGLRSERAGRALNVGYLQIVFAATWGALFFAEIPDVWAVAGALVVVTCTYLVGRAR